MRLRIRPDGSRSWIYRYRLNGKEKSIGLGPYPTVSLTIAREKAAENCSLVKTGSNPQLVRRLKRVNDAVKEGQTFSTVAKEWLEHNAQEWSRNYFIRNEGLLRRFLLPDLGRVPIHEITESYLFSVLKQHYDRGRKESVGFCPVSTDGFEWAVWLSTQYPLTTHITEYT